MSISTELTRMARNVGALTADTNAIFEALRAKGVAVPANAQLSDVADMIESIVIPHQNEVEIGGRWYPYVQIGNQLWLAENLDWKFSGCNIGSMTMTTSSKEAAYYNNDESTYGVNGKKYGLLYNWTAVNYIEQNKNTMLPTGWHVPTTSDYAFLVSSINDDAASIKSLTDWYADSYPATNTYGMSLLPCGIYTGSFGGSTTECYLWTATDNSSKAYYAYLTTTSNAVNYGGQVNKQYYLSLRLVRNLS